MAEPSNWQAASEQERALLEQCKAAVHRLAPAAALILYGSRSRHESQPTSDYDLLILVDEIQPGTEDRLGDALYEIELEHGVVISALVFDRRSWAQPQYRAMPLYRNIDRDGIVL